MPNGGAAMSVAKSSLPGVMMSSSASARAVCSQPPAAAGSAATRINSLNFMASSFFYDCALFVIGVFGDRARLGDDRRDELLQLRRRRRGEQPCRRPPPVDATVKHEDQFVTDLGGA